MWPNNFKMRWACLFRACIERSTGVFLSSASPVQETNAVGMHSVVPLGFSRMYAGLVTSQIGVTAGFERGANAAARGSWNRPARLE